MLARSRAVFTIQLLWLLALVPALIVGAKLQGIHGVGAAHVAVAALLVLPLYLWELHRSGVGVRAVLARIVPPALIAAVVGLAAVAAHLTISLDVVALAVAGLTALAAIGLLFHRTRGTLSGLRTLEGTDA